MEYIIQTFFANIIWISLGIGAVIVLIQKFRRKQKNKFINCEVDFNDVIEVTGGNKK